MILLFDSSIVMNLYTWNAAFVLFPWLTFLERCSVITQPREAPLSRDFKYMGRGFCIERTLLDHPKIRGAVHNYGLQPTRRLNDQFTWCLPFNVEGVIEPSRQQTVPLDLPLIVTVKWLFYNLLFYLVCYKLYLNVNMFFMYQFLFF